MKTIKEALEEYSFSEKISFDQEFFNELVDIAAATLKGYNGGYIANKKYGDLSRRNHDFFRYVWNSFSHVDRQNLLWARKEDSILGLKGKGDQSYEISKEIIVAIKKICDDIEYDHSSAAQSFLIHFNSVLDNPKSHLEQYLKFKEIDSYVAELWLQNGLSVSKDPSFYEMVWGQTKREEGYVEKQQMIIKSCVMNTDTVPELIANQISKSTRNSLKRCLAVNLASSISRLNSSISSLKASCLLDQAASLERFRESVVKRLTESIATLEGRGDLSPTMIINHLRPDELVWIAGKLKSFCTVRESLELEKKLLIRP